MTDKIQIRISVIKQLAVWVTILLFSATSAFAQSDILSPKAEEAAYEIGNIILSNNLITEDISSASELDFSNKSSVNIIRELLHHTHGIATLSNSLNPNEIIETYGKIISRHGNLSLIHI